MSLDPLLVLGKSTFSVSFRHPQVKSGIISRTLKTTDELETSVICLDILKNVRDPALWDIANPRLGLPDPRAVLAFHGQPHVPKGVTLPVNDVLVETMNFDSPAPPRAF